jgi:NTE family protein
MGRKTALVLSGGGARGLAHIGVIEELESQGFEITSIAGTSMGSLVGGVYAVGKLEEFKEWMLSLDKIRLLRLVDFSFSSQGLIRGDKVFNTMQEFISDAAIEELDIPYAAVAVDILNREEKVFTEGSMYEAIRASISIPSVFTPVKHGDSLLVDGGVLNNIPVNHVKRKRGDLLVAVDVNANVPVIKTKLSKKQRQERLSRYQLRVKQLQEHMRKILPGSSGEKMGYFKLLHSTISLMTYTIARMALEKHPPDLMINIARESAGTYDFYKADELIEIGHLATREALRKGR